MRTTLGRAACCALANTDMTSAAMNVILCLQVILKLISAGQLPLDIAR